MKESQPEKEKGDASFDHKKLWKQYRSTQNREIRDQLIVYYLPLVKKISRRLLHTLPSYVVMEDLYAPGVLGLIKAVEKFDPAFNTKFETYAALLIKGAIIDELRFLDWVPRSVHKRSQRVECAEEELIEKLGRFPNHKELSAYLNITEKELEKWRVQIQPRTVVSIHQTIKVAEDDLSLLDRIPDKKTKTSYELLEKDDQQQFLEHAILSLPEQERAVLVLYYYEGIMLKEIGQIIGISESRVSQIHTKAITRLKKKLSYLHKNVTETKIK